MYLNDIKYCSLIIATVLIMLFVVMVNKKPLYLAPFQSETIEHYIYEEVEK